MSLKLFDLSGKVALVTGSSRGLGKSMAIGLAQAGATVVLNATSRERLTAAAAEMRAAGHTVHEALFDVTDEAAVTAAFERLDGEGIAVDILVNNAGIQYRKPLIDLTTPEWQRVIDTNLTSAFVVGRTAAKRMLARGSGKIINMGSLTCEVARPTIAPYAVSKSGIKMLTKQMAAEWAAGGIQTNGIGPGYMVTDMNEALLNNPEFDAWVKARTPSRRWGQPEELVGAVIFLASSASNYVNGQMLYIDGGLVSVI